MLNFSATASATNSHGRRQALETDVREANGDDPNSESPGGQWGRPALDGSELPPPAVTPLECDDDRGASPVSDGAPSGSSLQRANTTSLFIFEPDSRVRKVCTAIHQHQVFKIFILFCIFLSAITLSADQPAVDNPDWLDQAISICDIIFVIVFLFEALVKIISMGFVMHPGAYLRSGWNMMDFAIALLSALALIVSKQIRFFRVFRVLRPLRTLQGVPELRNLVVAIFDAIPEVANNLLLFVFILLLFAISGVVLFGGALNYRCYVTELRGMGPPNATERRLPLYWNSSNITLPWLEQDDTDICGSRSCQNLVATEGVGVSCIADRNLYYRRNLNFDQLFAGSLLTLKIMTLDNWNEDMADLMNGVGSWCAIWFVLLTFIGAYICVNLFLAILTQSYHHRVKESSKEEIGLQADPTQIDAAFEVVFDTTAIEMPILIAPARQRNDHGNMSGTTGGVSFLPLSATASTIVLRSTRNLEDADADADDSSSGRSTPPRTKPSVEAARSPQVRLVGFEGAAEASTAVHLTSTNSTLVPTMTRHRAAGQATPVSSNTRSIGGDGKMVTSGGDFPMSVTDSSGQLHSAAASVHHQGLQSATGLNTLQSVSAPQSLTSANGHRRPPALRRSVNATPASQRGDATPQSDGSPRSEEAPRRSPRLASAFVTSPAFSNETAVIAAPSPLTPPADDGNSAAVLNGGIDPDVGQVSALRQMLQGVTCAFLLGQEESDIADDDRALWRVKLGKLLESILVQSGIALITLLNVATLAVDYHGIDSDLQSDMDAISLACTVFYFVNFFVVLIAFGFRLTFKSGFNVLDFVILLASIPDFLIGTGSTVFSVFRIFRLLRMLRLLRIKKLQPLIRTIIDSVTSIGYLALLILFFVFIFAISGMQIFGTDFNPNDASTTVRSSFGTVWQSALSVLIALTGEKWTLLLRTGMTLYSNGGEIVPVFFFCVVYLFGNYILINLSVAIILDSLEEKLSVFDEDDAEEHPPMLLMPLYRPPLLKKPSASRLHIEMTSPSAVTSSPTRSSSGGKRSRGVKPPVVGIVAAPSSPKSNRRTATPQRTPHAPASPMVGASGGGGAGRRKSILTDFLMTRQQQEDTPSTSDPASRTHTPDGRPRKEKKQAAVVINEDIPTAVEDAVAFPGYSFGEVSRESVQLAVGTPAVGAAGGASPDSPRSPNVKLGPMFADQIRDHTSSAATRLKKVIGYFTRVRPVIVEGSSFFIFAPLNPVRRVLIHVACSTAFERVIDLIIVANMTFLCFESPKNPNSTESVLRTADYIFSAVFALEMLIKMIAFGVFTPRSGRAQKGTGFAIQEAYFRDYWNWIDFIVVTMSFLAYVIPIFRASRALRSLRLVTRYETTRIIIVAVIQAIPHVLQGLIFVAFVFFVLGVIGVKFFKGRYYVCNDTTILNEQDCIGNFTQLVQGPVFTSTQVVNRQWRRSDFHFDNLGSALLTLFVVTVGDGWSDIMYDGMDTASDENVALQHFARPYMSLYFVVAYISCNFFALNMIVGVLVSYFAKKKRLHDGSALLTPAQRMYVKARYAIDATLADDLIPREESKAAIFLHSAMSYRYERLSKSTSIFDIFVMGVILINTVMIASTHEGMPNTLAKGIEIINNTALAIFIIEMLMKGFTYGVVQYLSFGWNVFDVAVIIIGIFGLFFDIAGLAVLRVIRLFKLIKGTGVEKLLVSLLRAAASFINITLLLILTYFVFAVGGVILFGNVKLNGVLTPYYNMQNVPNAILVLYTAATSSGWSDVMNACAIQAPDCDESLDECGSLPGSVAFFVIFMIVTTYVVLQLFVAVVVEIFLDEVNLNDPVIHAFGEMRAIWNSKFGLGVANISVLELADVLRDSPPALTDFTFDPNRADVMRLLGQLNVPIDSHFRVSYQDVVNSLAFRKFKVDLRSMARYLNDTVVSVFGRRFFTATHAYAIIVIQRGWRRRAAYLAQPRRSLRDVNTDDWLRRVMARRLAKAERSIAGSDSWCPHVAQTPPVLNSYSEATATFVPANCMYVPGSMVYAFPMVRGFDQQYPSPRVEHPFEAPSTSQNPVEIVPVDTADPPPAAPHRQHSRVRFSTVVSEISQPGPSTTSEL